MTSRPERCTVSRKSATGICHNTQIFLQLLLNQYTNEGTEFGMNHKKDRLSNSLSFLQFEQSFSLQLTPLTGKSGRGKAKKSSGTSQEAEESSRSKKNSKTNQLFDIDSDDEDLVRRHSIIPLALINLVLMESRKSNRCCGAGS